MIDPEPIFDDQNIGTTTHRPVFNRKALVLIGGVFLFALLVLYGYALSLNKPPEAFPAGREVVVPEGSSVRTIAELLSNDDVVRSTLYLQVVLKVAHEDSFLQAGSYTFPTPLTTTEVAEALVSGMYGTPARKATFPEGFKAAEISRYLPPAFETASEDDLRAHEGFLFPDTYFIAEDATLEEIIALMELNFERKFEPLREQVAASDLTEDEVVILASILEREGNDEVSMRTIAGILLTRLDIGMPLQVDATFEYLLGKASSELTEDDLEIDSPFNTYTNRGLPPTPISNPGLTAIEAVLNPIESDYLYYLTGNDGNFYYAETFEEHKQNKARYLR